MNELIEKAKLGQSNLTKEVLDLYGMSSAWSRHLLNLICEGKNYLEIGTHKGSTLISATYRNNSRGLAYDDYRKFGNHLDLVKSYIALFKVNSTIINADGFTHIGQKFDVIFYDGDHSTQSTIKSIIYFYDFLEPEGILIIDDYQFDPVRIGVEEALKSKKFSDSWVLESNCKDDSKTWWNGLIILKK